LIKDYLNPKLYSETGKRILVNSAYLIFGSTISKGLMFIVFIIAARYFGPDKYGAYSTAFSYVFLMGLLSKLGFDMTVIRTGARNLVGAGDIQNKIFPFRLFLSLFSWVLTILLLFILDFDYETTKIILIISPLIIIGGATSSGINDHFITYFNVIEKMNYIVYSFIIRTISFTFLVFLAIYSELLTIEVLAVLIVLSSLIGLFTLRKFIKNFYKHRFSWKLDILFIKPLIRPILLFGIVTFLFEMSLRINIIMLNKIGSNIEAGLFSSAWQIVNIGTIFIASFSMAIFPNSARNIFKKKFRRKAFLGFGLGTLALSIICILTPFFSEFIIQTLFGSEYIVASQVLNLIIWFLPFRFLSLWGHQILESADFLMIRIVVFIIPTILNIVLNFFLIPKYGAIGAGYASLVSNFVLLILALLSGIFSVRLSDKFEK